MMAGTVGSGQQLESASSGGCGRAELLWMANGEKENAETIGDDWRSGQRAAAAGWRQQGCGKVELLWMARG